MTGAGDFRTRLVLQVRDDEPDGQGGFDYGFSDVAKIWARVMPLSNRADLVADQNGATQRLRIEVRAPLEITRAHRLIDGDDVYRITGYRDDGTIVTIDAEVSLE